MPEVIRQAEDKDAQAKEYDRERDRKALELEKLEGQYQDARHLANGLRDAQDAAERVKAARAKLQDLSPKVDRDKELLKELSRLRDEIGKAELDAEAARRKLRQYQDIIDRKPDVEAAQAALDALAPVKAEAQERLAKSFETTKALLAAREAKDKHLADSRVRIGGASIPPCGGSGRGREAGRQRLPCAGDRYLQVPGVRCGSSGRYPGAVLLPGDHESGGPRPV